MSMGEALLQIITGLIEPVMQVIVRSFGFFSRSKSQKTRVNYWMADYFDICSGFALSYC